MKQEYFEMISFLLAMAMATWLDHLVTWMRHLH
jgi:hypothetical protein